MAKHQNFGTNMLRESLNFHPLLTHLGCSRNDGLDIHMFIHVDNGLRFGPSIDILLFVEHLSIHVMHDAHCGTIGSAGRSNIFLYRVIVRTARRYSIEANPKYLRDVIAVLDAEDSRPVASPGVKTGPMTELLVELENKKRTVHETAVGKLLYMCQERAVIIFSVKETA